MKISDFNKLKKLMNMTQSGSDQEILTAIRKANEIVAASNTTWDRVLDRVIKVEVEIESAKDAGAKSDDPQARAAELAARRKAIDEAFETIEASDPRGDWADFVADLRSQWDRPGGNLSPAQAAAILRGAKNAEKRR